MGTISKLLRLISYTAVLSACVAIALATVSCSKSAGTGGSQGTAPTAISANGTGTVEAPATEPSADNALAARSPAVLAVVASALAASNEADVAAIEKAIAAIDEGGLLAEAEASLKAALAEAVAAGKPAPGLHLALAAVYGRKGLADKAYAAVQAAEAAATAPGVSFSLAAIHGRKALLAPSSATGAFSLAVMCDIPGARASIDGGPAQGVPARFEALRPGKHEVSVTLSGYDTYIELVDGKDGNALSIAAVLIPALVPLSVATSPPGAEISIDGAVVGPSPWTGIARPGVRAISARLVGYEASTRSVSLAVASVANAEELALVPKPSWITVTSEPSGAKVAITTAGGVEVTGQTPYRYELRAVGDVNVMATVDDRKYDRQEARTISIEPGRDYSEHFEFQVGESEVMFMATKDLPVGTRLIVNGAEVGTIPMGRVKMRYGQTTIEAIAQGYEPFTYSLYYVGAFPIEIKLVKKTFVVPKRTITVDGAIDDWAGIEPACTDKSGDDRLPLEPGTDVSTVYLASDDTYVYARLDLVDGNRKSKAKEASCYTVRFAGDPVSAGIVVTVNLDVFYDVEARTWKTQIWLKDMDERGVDRSDNRDIRVAFQFKLGDSAVEMRVARSTIQKYFKTAGPFLVWGQYHIWEKWGATGDDTERTRFTFGW